MAKFKGEFIEIAWRLSLRRVPLPLGNIARGNDVRLQDQCLAPKSVVSTAAVRVIHGGALATDRNLAGQGCARSQDGETRYYYFSHKSTPLGLTLFRHVRAIKNFKVTNVTCQVEFRPLLAGGGDIPHACRGAVVVKITRPAGSA
jgi:hypothetical protein